MIQMATLILEDGTSFTGQTFGAATDAEGEVVFGTGMVGYPETFTDPSYRGQILTLTYPLIGNYGIPKETNDTDGIRKYFESDTVHMRGVIVSEYSQRYSHWQAHESLSDWLKRHNVPGITGIDTRALTKKLREKGAMLGRIIQKTESGKRKADIHDPNKDNLADEVSIKKPTTYKRGRKTVVLFDCGVKNNIIRSLLARNLTVIRVPWNYDIFKNKLKYDGIVLSNGPGDPALLTALHEIIRKALEQKKPIFGICLGVQIMAIAAGAQTYKLKYGHRSQNQPCTNLETGRCYLTSQNHGFAINPETLPADWKVWWQNTNDRTVEGIKHEKLPFSAVQFHPEATPGPVDTQFLFDEFTKKL